MTRPQLNVSTVCGYEGYNGVPCMHAAAIKRCYENKRRQILEDGKENLYREKLSRNRKYRSRPSKGKSIKIFFLSKD